MKIAKLVFVQLLICNLILACSSNSDEKEAEKDVNEDVEDESDLDYAEGDDVTGEEVFTKLIRDANAFTCATCHSVDSANDDFRRVGHDLDDVASRTSFKNGELVDLRDAVNNCIEEWMVGVPWEENDTRWIALLGWFEAQAPETAENISYEIVDPPTELEGGNITEGMVAFNLTCAACHGLDAVGTDRGPSLAGTSLSAAQIAGRIRKSGPIDNDLYPDLEGGVMPFWSADRLSDEEIVDIVAFLDETEEIESMKPADSDISVANAQSDCDSSHPDVGKSVALSKFSHDVAGVVHVIDDCTLEIRGFTFDGGGIDVRIYGAKDGAYHPPPVGSGFAISKNIKGTSFADQTVQIRLPESVSLDDLNGISVWCVPIGIDFGSAEW